jgi:hypothetical protein
VAKAALIFLLLPNFFYLNPYRVGKGECVDIFQVLIVFGLSIAELWVGIPAGFAFNLTPFLIVALSSSGSILSALLMVFAGEKIRERIIRWRYKGKEPKRGLFSRIWNKYGVIGLGLLSPLLFGAPLGAAVGVALGGGKWRLLLWISMGIVIWAIGLTFAGVIGLGSIKRLF